MKHVKVWFTSDTHFRHTLVANHRGFDTYEDHDAALIESWNECVRPGDIVWHLGDVSMGSIANWQEKVLALNGNIHLIPGNHDDAHPMHRDAYKHQGKFFELFESVQAFTRRKVYGQEVLLSHFPYEGEGERDIADRYTQYRLRNEGIPLIHGHTHSHSRKTWVGGVPQIHVGWDAWRRPVHIDEVWELLG
jgi:calcineurin-like phosphoesterase family protein